LTDRRAPGYVRRVGDASRRRESKPSAVGRSLLGLAFVAVFTALVASAARPATADVSASGPVIQHGYVVDRSGNPARAHVMVHLWEPDASGYLPPVGDAVTDEDGYYEIRTENTDVIRAAAAENGGWANFMLYATDGAWDAESAFSRRYTATGTWETSDSAAPEAERLVLEFPVDRPPSPDGG
jgi:hypothetical protein